MLKSLTAMLATVSLLVFFALTASPPVSAQSPLSVVSVTTATYSDRVTADVYEVDASANAVALTLSSPSKRRRVTVVKTDSSTNAVTVTTAGTGATINGSASYALVSQHDAATFIANGRSGSTGVWRVAASNRRVSEQTADKTVTTTGNTDFYVVAPEAGTLVSAVFSGADALAQHASNYVTFSITNLGQAGAGTAAMLAATDANTTKTTTGAAVAAGTKRTLTLTSTGADLVVAAGDRLRVRAAATGTLANTVTFAAVRLSFAAK